MLDGVTLLTYATVVFGLFLIPGPAVLLVLARATSGGRRVGVSTGLGIACGDLIHTAMATVGLSAVLMTSATAFSVVKWLGVTYLGYLGIRAFMEGSKELRLDFARCVNAPLAFRQAVVAEVLNPKTAIFFLAFLPQFVRTDRGGAPLQLAMLGLVFVAMSAVYISLIALAASWVGTWLSNHRRVGRWQGRVVGTVYIAVGVRLALEER